MVLMASCCLFIRLRDVERVRVDAGAAAGHRRGVGAAHVHRVGRPVSGLGARRGRCRRRGPRIDAARLAAYLATDQRTGHPGYLAWIAAAQLRGGDPAGALDTLAHAATALPEELVDVSAIWRIRGGVLEADPALGGSDATAAGCYEHAIAAARQFGSVMLELETATELARLRRREGEPGAARALVEPLLARIAGGDEIPDVLDAALCRARRLRRTGGERIGLHHRRRRDGSGTAVVPRPGRASPSRDHGDIAARGVRPGRALDDRAREAREAIRSTSTSACS